MVLTTVTKRPRDVDTLRAGALLYGDLGTSKAYVIGLAFAIAGYSSFWLILAVSILCVLVGINYVVICRCYPNGGGVYASVRNRSEVLSLVGAFFIIADYLVTASLSGLAAFSYFGVTHPVIWTCVAIAIVGCFNYFGPRHTGKYAFIGVIFTVTCLIILVLFCLPHLREATHNLQPLKGDLWKNWRDFVGVIVALSGVEAIANTTGVMRLDPGSTAEKPCVSKTATRAIVWVIIEVAILTSLFSFVSMSLDGLKVVNDNVYSPEGVAIRDFWLRYLSEVFVGKSLGALAGKIFGGIISLALGLLLLSAVNTAINGLIALQYLLAQDGELPRGFERLNRFGVPIYAIVVATAIPIVILIAVRDLPGLANLYAIGFVGAIATNLAATSTDRNLGLRIWERGFMFFTFLIMFTVEITLFIDKPKARFYVLMIILGGLLLRGLAREARERRPIAAAPPTPEFPPLKEKIALPTKAVFPAAKEKNAILCIVRGPGNSLSYALTNAEKMQIPLYLLYIREQKIIAESDLKRNWEDDEEAAQVFNWAKENTSIENLYFYYTVTDSAATSIVRYAERLEVEVLIIEAFSRNPMWDFLQGNLLHDIRKILPENIRIIVIT